jgi:hypothetical protein
MHFRVTFLSLFAALAAVASSQTCYGLDGTTLDDTFAPCNPSAKHSGCCATKRSSGADICLDNGLCMSTRDETIGMIWQSGCTDATGKDVACPKICPDGTFHRLFNFQIRTNEITVTAVFGVSHPVPAWNVQQCDYGTYCCRASTDRHSCCNNAAAPKVTTSHIGALQVQSQTTVTVTPSATTEPTHVAATAIITGTPFAATAAPSCAKERHHTAVVGGAIGGVFGAIIVGLLGALLWMYKQEKHHRKMKEHYEEQFAQTSVYRRNIASSAASLMGGDVVEVKSKPGGS